MAEGDVTGALEEFEQAIAYGAAGDVHVAHAQAALAVLLAATGKGQHAKVLAAEAVAAARRFRLPGVLVMALVRAAQTYLRCDDDAGGREALRELFTLLHQLGTRPFRAEALDAAAVLAHRAGDHPRAARCLGAAQAVRLARAEEAGSIDALGPALTAARTACEVPTLADITHAADHEPLAYAVAETRAWLEDTAEVPSSCGGSPSTR